MPEVKKRLTTTWATWLRDKTSTKYVSRLSDRGLDMEDPRLFIGPGDQLLLLGRYVEQTLQESGESSGLA